MRTKGFKTNSGSSVRGVIHPVTATILAIVGFLLFQPFFWIVLVFENSSNYITFPIFMAIIGCVIGLPMFFMGIISLMVRKSRASGSTYNDHDVSRIRYAVEQDRINRR